MRTVLRLIGVFIVCLVTTMAGVVMAGPSSWSTAGGNATIAAGATAGEVAFFTSATAIGGDPELTYNASTNQLSVGSVAATGAISGASVAATGAITGASVAATGALTGATATLTGQVQSASWTDTVSKIATFGGRTTFRSTTGTTELVISPNGTQPQDASVLKINGTDYGADQANGWELLFDTFGASGAGGYPGLSSMANAGLITMTNEGSTTGFHDLVLGVQNSSSAISTSAIIEGIRLVGAASPQVKILSGALSVTSSGTTSAGNLTLSSGNLTVSSGSVTYATIMVRPFRTVSFSAATGNTISTVSTVADMVRCSCTSGTSCTTTIGVPTANNQIITISQTTAQPCVIDASSGTTAVALPAAAATLSLGIKDSITLHYETGTGWITDAYSNN